MFASRFYPILCNVYIFDFKERVTTINFYGKLFTAVQLNKLNLMELKR